MSREVTSWIDIRNFGYFGDGINSDVPAFNAALEAMKAFGSYKGAALLLPPSVAFIPDGETVTVPDGLEIEGAAGQTLIKIGGENPGTPNTGFIVADGSSALFTNVTFKGPLVSGVPVLAVDKQGTTGTLYLTNVDAINPANAGVQVAAGCVLEIGDCAEVGNDFTTAQGAPITYTSLGEGLWGGTASHQPRQIKGEVDPSAGGGVPAPQGSTYQRYAVGGQIWVKTGAADTAWGQLIPGGGPDTDYYQTVALALVPFPQEDILNFTSDFTVTDDPGSNATTIGLAISPSAITLQGAYNNGGAGPQIIQEDNVRNGIVIRDVAAPNQQTPAFSVTNSGGTLTYYGLSAFGSAIAQDDQAGFPYQTLTIFPGALTNMTASTEWVGFDWFAGTKAKQWATGALATQRAALFRASTLSFVGASTVTTAATLAVDNAPQAGANATITSSYALWVQAGLTALDGGLEMANASPAVSLANTGRIKYNSGTQTFQASLNGAAYVDIATGSPTTTLQQAYTNGGSAGTAGTIVATALGGNFSWTQGNFTSGTPVGFTYTDGTHTGLTNAINLPSMRLNFSSTKTITNSPTIPTMTTMLVSAATYAFTSAPATITTAATLYIDKGPQIGANATITTAYGLYVAADLAALNGGLEMANAAPSVSLANTGRIKYNSGTQTFQVSLNGAAYVDVATGTASTPTWQQTYTAGAGGTAGTVTATNAKGEFVWNQGVATSGSPTGFTYVDAAHTTLAVGTEAPSANWNLSSTKQFSTGAITTQRAFVVQAPTYGFVGASTITTAATLSVSGAPVAGTNATITQSYAIWAQTGLSAFDGGIEMANASPAVSQSNTGRIKYDSGTQTFQASLNGAAYASIQTGATTLQSAYNNGSGGTAGTITATTSGGDFSWTQGNYTTGTPTGFTYVDGAPTTLTASAEAVSVNWNLSSSHQFSTGAITTQRAMRIQAPTYRFVGASTITTAGTLSVSGPPIASTNATITRAYTIICDSTSSIMLMGTSEQSNFVTNGGAFNCGVQAVNTGQTPAFIAHGAAGEIVMFSGQDFAGQTNAGLGTSTNHTVSFYANSSKKWTLGTTGVFAAQQSGSVITSGDGAAGTFYAYGFASGGAGIYREATAGIAFGVNSTSTIHTWDNNGRQVISPVAASTGNVSPLVFTAPANTNQTASAEQVAVNYNLSATVQHATGAIATQRAFLIQAPTYSFVGASTITTGVTLDVTGEPTAGTNATINNKYAIRSGGPVRINGNIDATGAANLTIASTDAGGNGSVAIYGGSQVSTGLFITATSASATILSGTGSSGSLNLGCQASATSLIINADNTWNCTTQAPSTATRTYYSFTTANTSTNRTASTEVPEVNWNLAKTYTWATGALTTQRSYLIQPPTYAFAGASTITTAIGLEVGAPAAGTNATITNRYAINATAPIRINAAGNVTAAGSLLELISTTSGCNITWTTATNPFMTVGENGTTAWWFTASTNAIQLSANGNAAKFVINGDNTFALQTDATTSATRNYWSFTGANTSTNRTASTEVHDVKWNLGQTMTWATGALATQRSYAIFAPTYAFAGASTITTAATLAISGAPTAGTNATITTALAFWVQGGATRFDGNIGFFTTAPVAQQTVGAVTNNVTAGGVDGTIANYTDLTVYANDAAAIRNDIYQLARSVAQLATAVRNLGLAA